MGSVYSDILITGSGILQYISVIVCSVEFAMNSVLIGYNN